MSMKIVCTFGAFDILHSGHLKFLEKARSFGDKLIVGVQSDAAIAQCKPEPPAIPEAQRLEVVQSLKWVDEAELYDFDYLEKFEKSGANILVMSELHRDVERFQEMYNCVKGTYGEDAVKFLPPYAGVSSTEIKKEIRDKSWTNIWDNVAASDKNDWEICGYSKPEDVGTMAVYIRDKMDIAYWHRILDYGCGSGLILKCLGSMKGSVGVDASLSMIKRAQKNNPEHIFFVSNRPLVFCYVDVVISWGVFQYMDSYSHAELVIKDMLRLCPDNILIMEIPDVAKKAAREAHRKELGMNPWPPHLYFNKFFFEQYGFNCYDNDIHLTKHSHFSFTAIRRPK